MYYNMEERLEKDAEQAEAEYAKAQAFLDKITPKFVKKRMKKDETEDKTEIEEE